MEKIRFQQQRDFSQKISATFDFISQNFRPLFKCLLFIAGPTALLTGIFMSYYLKWYFNVIGEASAGNDPDLMFASGWTELAFIGGGLTISSMLTMIIVVTVIYDYIKIYIEQPEPRTIAPGEVLGLLKSDAFRILGVGIVAGVLLGLSLLVVVIPILGFLIAIPLMVYLSVVFSLTFIIVVYERANIFGAISRSFELISGKWWSTFGLIFVCYLIQSVISFIFILPTYLVHGVSLFHSIQEGFAVEPTAIQNILSIIFSSVSMIGANLLYAIPLIAVAFQYFNLVERKEGAGLLQQIDQMGKEDLVNDQGLA